MLRSVIYHKKQKYFLAIFCSVLQLVGIEITYEGVERNLGVNNRRNYAKIVVVNRSALIMSRLSSHRITVMILKILKK
jgi:hypothetical protein